MAVELLLVLFALVVMVAFLVPWLLALVDALRRPDGEWAAAGQNKLLWVLVIVFAGFVGAIVYFAVALPALNRAHGGAIGTA